MSKETSLITPTFRVSYANVFVARAVNAGDTEKFSITMLFEKKGTDLAGMVAAAKAAKLAKWGANPPSRLRSPFRDGDDPEEEDRGEAYKGKIFVYASSTSKPGVLDEGKNPINSPEAFYSGCYAIASVNAFAYEAKGNKGISFGLNNLMKMADGERLDGHTSAEEDFKSYDSFKPESDDLGMDDDGGDPLGL